MPLYMGEIYVNASSPDNVKKFISMFQQTLSGGFPPGVTRVAGPWASNEEAKLILIVNIEDHSLTFDPFSKAVTQGLVLRRRLTPIVEWGAVEKMASEL